MCQAVVPASDQEIPVQVSLAPEQRKGNKAIVIAKINLLSLSSHDNLVYTVTYLMYLMSPQEREGRPPHCANVTLVCAR